MQYKWKEGARIKGVDPQVAGERLDWIRAQHGGLLTAQMVVEDGESPDSPLFGLFEDDPEVGLVQYQLVQARELIRSVVMIREDRPQARPIRAFVMVTEDHERSYTHIVAAMGSKEMRDQIVARAWREFQSWQQRYQDIEEFAAIFEAAEQARKRRRSKKAA